MSIMSKFLSGAALSALLVFSASAQQIQGLNNTTGLICSGCTITNPTITGGSIDNTPIGNSTPSTGKFTILTAPSIISSSGNITLTANSGIVSADVASGSF